MFISIIIITKDRPEPLIKCLDSISRQSILPDEVIIVDSSQDTKIVKEYLAGNNKINFQYYTSIPGMTKQRNLGISKVNSRSEIIIFCDDDITLDRDAFYKIADFFNDHKEAAGLTGDFILEPKASFIKKIFGYLSGVYTTNTFGISCGIYNIINSSQKIKKVEWVSGAFMAFRTAIVRQHPFDEWFTAYSLGEDLDYSLQIKKRGGLYYLPDVKIRHHRFRQNFDWKNFGSQRIVNRYYIYKKHFSGSAYYFLGYWWANFWLMVFNLLRGLIIKKYRQELIGNYRGLADLFKKDIFR